MIVDSIYRQFLVYNKYLIRISSLEDKLGITGKSIQKWVLGKKPLPSKWEEPLKSLLFPMVDEHHNSHKMVYKADKVVVLLESQVLIQFNTGFASGGVKCKIQVLCFYSSSVQVDSFVLRNPPERKARKRCMKNYQLVVRE